MTIEVQPTTVKRIAVSGIAVEVVRKDIKNLHLGVYPPLGRVRVAAPLVISDEAVRLAVDPVHVHLFDPVTTEHLG